MFSVLESFIEERLEEKLADLPRSKFGYTGFDQRLQSLLVLDAAVGLSNRVGFLERQDRLGFVQAHVPLLAAFVARPPKYSALGFSPKGSNVSAEDVESLLRAFGVQEPWTALGRVSAEIGFSSVSLKVDFNNFARARNRAAHDSASNTPTGDLAIYARTAILVGVGVDLLLSHAVDCFVVKPDLASALAATSQARFRYRFVDQDPHGGWVERSGPLQRVVKRYPDRGSAVNGATARKIRSPIIVRDRSLLPLEVL